MAQLSGPAMPPAGSNPDRGNQVHCGRVPQPYELRVVRIGGGPFLMPPVAVRERVAVAGSVEGPPELAGHPPASQGAVLADLIARWIVGHHPKLREFQIKEFLTMVKKLIPINEQMMFGPEGHPGFKDAEEERQGNR